MNIVDSLKCIEIVYPNLVSQHKSYPEESITYDFGQPIEGCEITRILIEDLMKFGESNSSD